jgi:hypothetical protein
VLAGGVASSPLLRSMVGRVEVGEDDVECWVVVGVEDMVTFRER